MTRSYCFFITAVIFALLLTACAAATPAPLPTATQPPAATAASASSPTAASSPTPAITPTVAAQTGLKPGRWEGTPHLSFDVLPDGRIANLSILLSVGNPGSACLIKIPRWDPSPDATFTFTQTAPTADISDTLRRLLNQIDAVKETADGSVVEQQRLDAKIVSPTQITGTYNAVYCDGSYYFSQTEGEWSAEWKK